MRDLPLQYTSQKAKYAYAAYQLFQVDEPTFDRTTEGLQGQLLRATREYFEAFNTSRRLHEVVRKVCYHSILTPGFNEQYSKLYKYARQAILATRWERFTPDWPVDEDIGISSWAELKELFKLHEPASPEVLLPPELLYPWASPRPEDIEYLEAEGPECTLDRGRIKDILQSILVKPRMIPTTTDFIMSQTNTKKCLGHQQAMALIQGQKPDKITTEYKYSAVTEWVDKGMPRYPHIAVRTPVWKRTTEYRDAITLAPWTLYEVWKLNAYLKHMINHKGVGDYTDQTDLYEFCKDHDFFIMTDWKKSGLTIPHWFCEDVVDVINSYLTNDRVDFPTKGWPIYDHLKQKFFVPENHGYGLGMINNVYTIFNIVLFEYAKQEEIFTEKDKILSFNDDSIIAAQESVYNRWLGICRKSGGWLDEHKTFASTGGMFCEMHHFKNLKQNFKWVSAFHTLQSALWKAYNWDHWRFLVSDMWGAITRHSDAAGRQGMINYQTMAATAENYTAIFSEQYWGKSINNDFPPEMGGVSLGTWHRTPYSLKQGLLILEDLHGYELFKHATILRVTKEHFAHHPTFRPWVKMPKGPTRDSFLLLGKVKGLHHELESLSLKAHNQFLIDSEWYYKEFWGSYSKKLDEYADPIPFDIWDWAKQHVWPTYAIPDAFVVEKENLHNNQILPFVRMQKAKPIYSLPSMVAAYYHWFGLNVQTEIAEDDIDFRPYLQWEAAIHQDAVAYIPIMDMDTISMLSEFSDPRRVILDYHHRHKQLIVKMDCSNPKPKAALDLIKRTFSDASWEEYTEATWWTKLPLPIKEEWKETIFATLPDIHERLILDLMDEKIVEPKEFVLSYQSLEADKRRNPKFWKERTRSKKKSAKKKASQRLQPQIPIQEDQDLSLINMDDIREVMLRVHDNFEPPTPTEPVPFEVDQFRNFEDLINYEDFGDEAPPPEEGEWDPEATSDDERRMIAEALDAYEESDEDYVPDWD